MQRNAMTKLTKIHISSVSGEQENSVLAVGTSPSCTRGLHTKEDDRLVGLVVKESASRAEDPGVRIPLAPGFFRGRVIPVT